MALPPLPKALRSVGAPTAPEFQRRVDEWARGTQDLLEALRNGNPSILRRLDTLESAGVEFGSPIALVVGGANSDGTSENAAKADHKHELPPFGDGAGEFCEGDDARLDTAPGAGTYYMGHATGNVDWTSTTWTGIHNAHTITDDAQVGVSRSSSDFTFTDAGKYRVQVDSIQVSDTTSQYLGIRARLSGATIGSGITYADSRNVIQSFSVSFVIDVEDSDVVTLQYAVSANTAGSFVTSNIDSQTCNTLNISIYRIGA